MTYDKSHVVHRVPLPADPEERRVAMARRGLRGLPGQTRTTSSWHCKQMTWFSWLSLLQPLCSPPAWIFIPLLIWRTSRMSAPVSCSSILLTGGGHTYYAWLLRVKATASPVPKAFLTPPTALEYKRCLFKPGLPGHRLTSAPSCQPLSALVAVDVAVFTHDCRRGCFTWSVRSQCQVPVRILVAPR